MSTIWFYFLGSPELRNTITTQHHNKDLYCRPLCPKKKGRVAQVWAKAAPLLCENFFINWSSPLKRVLSANSRKCQKKIFFVKAFQPKMLTIKLCTVRARNPQVNLYGIKIRWSDVFSPLCGTAKSLTDPQEGGRGRRPVFFGFFCGGGQNWGTLRPLIPVTTRNAFFYSDKCCLQCDPWESCANRCAKLTSPTLQCSGIICCNSKRPLCEANTWLGASIAVFIITIRTKLKSSSLDLLA